jgi:antitoxin (DNA-binding transcriptional repressor) of toxin-antitoxin stability system
MKATQLRANLYKTLDEVIATGKPVRVERKGKVVLIVPESPIKQQRVFKKRKLLVNPDEDITEIDWMSEWRKNNAVPEGQFKKKR